MYEDVERVQTLTLFDAAIAEGHGDTAMLLLRAGAEGDKQDGEGRLPIHMAPDDKVNIAIAVL